MSWDSRYPQLATSAPVQACFELPLISIRCTKRRLDKSNLLISKSILSSLSSLESGNNYRRLRWEP